MSKSKDKLMPATAGQIQEFESIKYLEGNPRSYRFDAKKGVLKFGDSLELTKPGEQFHFVPIAFRIFDAEMFQYEKRSWAEVFFFNAAGQLSVIMFHGISVEALRGVVSDLFYDDVTLCGTTVTVIPRPRANEFGSYFSATFEAAPLPDGEAGHIQVLVDSIDRIFQYKTSNNGLESSVGENFGLPIGLDGSGLIEESKEEE